MSTPTAYGVGLDLGGTQIKALAITPAGDTVREHTRENGGDEPVSWIAGMQEILADWRADLGAAPRFVGLCAPGLAARDARSIAFMPGRMEALQGLVWGEALKLDVPVRVLNDAHAALLGEVGCGAAQGARNAVMLTLGTGVGGAILCDGHLLRGHLGRAGHIGHLSLDPDGLPGITGAPGCLEDAIGNCTLPRRTGGRFHDTRALLDAVSRGDGAAASVWQASVRALGAGIVSIINAVDPEVIVIGGGIAAAGDALFAPLAAYMDDHEWRPAGHRVTVARARLGEHAGALGAALYARDFGGSL